MPDRSEILQILQEDGGSVPVTAFYEGRRSQAESLRTHNELAKLRREGLVKVERVKNPDGSRGVTLYHLTQSSPSGGEA